VPARNRARGEHDIVFRLTAEKHLRLRSKIQSLLAELRINEVRLDQSQPVPIRSFKKMSENID